MSTRKTRLDEKQNLIQNLIQKLEQSGTESKELQPESQCSFSLSL